MSTTLTDFLREKAAHEAHHQRSREEQLSDWRQAVEKLLNRICDWLKQADPNGVIDIKKSETRINEEGLGRYQIPGLVLSAFGRSMMVMPKARFTIATVELPHRSTPERASGRVDLTDDTNRIILHRFRGDDGDIWMIEDIAGKPRLFDQNEFESALMSFLK